MTAQSRSRYHMFRQIDGKGFGILRQDALGSLTAWVVDTNMSHDDARAKLLAYRREESAP